MLGHVSGGKVVGGDHCDGLVAFVEGLEGLDCDFLAGGYGADGGVGGMADVRGCAWWCGMLLEGGGGGPERLLYSCCG